MQFDINQIRPETRARLDKYVAEQGFKNLSAALFFIWRNDSRIMNGEGQSSLSN